MVKPIPFGLTGTGIFHSGSGLGRPEPELYCKVPPKAIWIKLNVMNHVELKAKLEFQGPKSSSI